MNDAERERAAKFLGHSLSTHKEYYRLSDHAYDSTKIATLLQAMEQDKLPTQTDDRAQAISEFMRDYINNDNSDCEDDEEDIPDLEEEQTSQPMFTKELIAALSSFFKKFIKGDPTLKNKKPNLKDVSPFLKLIEEKEIGFQGSWRDIADKVWELTKNQRKKEKNAEKRTVQKKRKEEKKKTTQKM